MKNIFFYKNYFKITQFILLIIILLTSLNSVNWNDDFNYLTNLKKNGFFGESLYQYMNWDGRGLSPLFLIRNILLYYFPPNLLVVIGLSSIFITSYFIVLFLNKKLFINEKNEIFSLVLGSFLWYGYHAHIARSVYWATGSGYVILNLLLFTWFYFYNKSNSKNIFFLFLTFTIMSCGTNINAMVLTCMFLFHFFNIRLIKIKEDLQLLFVIFFSLIASLFAPGNFIRAKQNYSGVDLNYSHFIKNYFMVLKEYLFMSKWILILGIIFGITFFLLNKSIYDKIILKKLSFFFLLIGLSSIVPFIIVPEAASKHTSIHFQTCFFISILLFIIYLLSFLNFTMNKNYSYLLINIFSIFLIYVAINQLILGREVKKQIVKRYNYLESKRGTKEALYLDKINQPNDLFTNRIWDINNPVDDGNVILQNYFETGPIFVKK